MNIIEKLGGTLGPWISLWEDVANSNEHSVWSRNPSKEIARYNKKEDSLLIAAAPEMLEALIDSVKKGLNIEMELGESPLGEEFAQMFKFDLRVRAIEKATGKSWAEIKELL